MASSVDGAPAFVPLLKQKEMDSYKGDLHKHVNASSNITKIPYIEHAYLITCGLDHCVAACHGTGLWTWGANTYGQCGVNSVVDVHEPHNVIFSADAIGFGAGESDLYDDASDRSSDLSEEDYDMIMSRLQDADESEFLRDAMELAEGEDAEFGHSQTMAALRQDVADR